MTRPSKDEWLMELALVTAKRGTCARRRVGCVLANEKGEVLSTGYNGTARGLEHCISTPCAGAGLKSGTGLDLCEAVHAEQNALLQCRDVEEICTCYSTVEPCLHCTKLLLNTGCRRVLFLEPYAHSGAAELWNKAFLAGRRPGQAPGWTKFALPP